MSLVKDIIFAFSLPYIKSETNQKEINKVAFYIDNSFSMKALSEAKNELLDYAKNNTKKIINNLKPTQKILIITNDFEKKHQKWYTKQEAISLVE